MSAVKALAGKLIKAKIVKDAKLETELLSKRCLLRDHFKFAIGQAALHKELVTTTLLAEAIIWACTESGVPRKAVTRAYRVLGISPPRTRKRRVKPLAA